MRVATSNVLVGGRTYRSARARAALALCALHVLCLAGLSAGCASGGGYVGECGTTAECGEGEFCDAGACNPVFGRTYRMALESVDFASSSYGRVRVLAGSLGVDDTCSTDWCGRYSGNVGDPSPSTTCSLQHVCEFHLSEDTQLDISVLFEEDAGYIGEYYDAQEVLHETLTGDQLRWAVTWVENSWRESGFALHAVLAPTSQEASR